ncbi:bifunctional DNA-formamidopyrimidine glycosylase/DNA-(apurinic or apyrimidinic site) lyase [Nesterenkonia alkaliphila]|uniref:Formamidopyrimidine-DNA glycosylase n=1 Tax=Nesterenkonia alkaliphila TaxID=1463631 RepID=A0A7K1UMJ3_9MICC|nr:bifunctional DNA-formamidopyrimidine glycosylase/DNA-(apurinic or apyrimidinic site) lyase [Nesterenkonia alkaliphila]MVT27693.1 bifunctional DNA-formamidopyrimidine glycosylase/DNA-(apurinic or apyrimidinic site) lyase [Nesterenkonia alkaliphila]GFZ87838.1 formamidopyrimidine-DNA glycosylase [Nesterenkonia alkaliphila]
MPELPEVEVVRRGVEQWAAGRRVEQVQVHDARSLRRFAEGPEAFTRQLTGAVLGEPQRRGKFLWIPLRNDHDAAHPALVIHLGMSGQVLIEHSEAPAEKHLKITLDLGERIGAGPQHQLPSQLRFIDQRIFGGMQLSPLGPDTAAPGSGRLIPEVAAHIAPDPLEETVTTEWLFQVMRRRRTGLKRALLDQTVISGVGNIYADEALWLARMHYARRTETLTRAQAGLLLESLREVMQAALAAGGTSFDALYVNVNGASGYFERSLEVYGRPGRECSRCGGTVRREKFMNRSSYFCPICQPRPRADRW